MKRLQPIWKQMTIQVLDHAAIGIQSRSLRIERGLTLQQVATAAGMSISMLSHLEHGDRRWSDRYMQRVAAAIETAGTQEEKRQRKMLVKR